MLGTHQFDTVSLLILSLSLSYTAVLLHVRASIPLIPSPKMMTKTLLALAAAQVATAHYGLIYPEWRADTLADDTEFDQWVHPCMSQLRISNTIEKRTC